MIQTRQRVSDRKELDFSLYRNIKGQYFVRLSLWKKHWRDEQYSRTAKITVTLDQFQLGFSQVYRNFNVQLIGQRLLSPSVRCPCCGRKDGPRGKELLEMSNEDATPPGATQFDPGPHQ